MNPTAARGDAAGQRQRHGAEHDERVARRAQRTEQEKIDEQEAAGYDDHQTLTRDGEILELSAPGQETPRRELYLLVDFGLRFRHHGADVPSADFGGRDDTPLAVFTADLVGSFGLFERCQGPERY